jgi:hypothetical protein
MKLNADQWMVMFEVEREICTCLSLCTEVHSGRDSEALQASEEEDENSEKAVSMSLRYHSR